MEEPKSAHDHYERGRTLKRAQMFHQAREEFQQVVNDPEYAGNAYVQIALCLLATGRYDDAVEAFRQALEVGTYPSREKAHILYMLGKTLEALGRVAEALEAYGWTRKEVPGFQDVAQRIKHLLAGGGGRAPLPRRRPASRSMVGDMLRLGGQLTPQVLNLLGQTWTSLGQYVDSLGIHRGDQQQSPSHVGHPNGEHALTPMRCGPPASRDRRSDTRRHVRVAVRLQSHFSSKERRVAGDGELRDLSPGGCRVTSLVAVPVGAELECCIVSQDAGNPFTIDGATVRWSRPHEFGLAFTKVRPGVQRQIAQLCRQRTL